MLNSVLSILGNWLLKMEERTSCLPASNASFFLSSLTIRLSIISLSTRVKRTFFELLFQHAHHRNVQLSIHQQHIVSFIRSGLYIAVLFIFIVGIQINQISILIRLVIFNQRLILFESIIFAVCIGERQNPWLYHRNLPA